MSMFNYTNKSSLPEKVPFPQQLPTNNSTAISHLRYTKYSEPFGKLFMKKNRNRFSQFNQSATKHQNPNFSSSLVDQQLPLNIDSKPNKVSERYLNNKITNKHLSKLSGIGSQGSFSLGHYNGKIEINQSALRNQNSTLNNSGSKVGYMNAGNTRIRFSSKSYRSDVLMVNVDKLPKLEHSRSFFNSSNSSASNYSHSKASKFMQQLNGLSNEIIQMTKNTQEIKKNFQILRHSLEAGVSSQESALNSKVDVLNKLTLSVVQNSKKRNKALYQQTEELKEQGANIGNNLRNVESRIKRIQNSLGIDSSKFQHFM